MEFDLHQAASQLHEAWRVEERVAKHDGVEAKLLIIRAGDQKRVVDLKPFIDNWRSAPERIVGTATMQTPEKFIELVDRHATADTTALFCDAMSTAPSIQAVIDYHALTGGPGWMKHRIKYGFPLSREWQFWNAINAKGRLDQAEFAFLIEDRIADVVKADPKNAAEVELASQMGVTIRLPNC